MRLLIRPLLVAALCLPWLSLLFADKSSISPLDLHHELRRDFKAGRDVSERVRSYRARTGDHSFDSLETSTAMKIQGLNQQDAAKAAWVSGDRESAERLYSRAYRLFLEENADGEAGFCLYYLAEILSEQEKYGEALSVLEGVPVSRGNCLYLEALLNESAGFCFWFLDRLQDSTRAFSRAADRWVSLGYTDGMVGAWNNLAALHDELNMWERAAEFYEKALELEDVIEAPSIHYTLHANYASLLLQLGRQKEARIQLEAARPLSQDAPQEFLLIESQVDGLEKSEKRLLELRPETVSLEIERALLLGKLYMARDTRKGLEVLRRAIDLSASQGLSYQKRRCVAALGQLLESERRYSEAAELYQRAFKEEENLYSPELLFPYSRVVSPLFDGWIRSLIESGNSDQALDGIHRLVALRRMKAEAIDHSAPARLGGQEGLTAFAHAARAEGTRVKAAWDTLPGHPRPNGVFVRDGVRSPVLVELWPDHNRIYAWVFNSSGHFFRVLDLEASVNQTLEPVLAAVYTDGPTLPPPPEAASLRRLYTRIVEPLVPFLDSPNVVAVVHKELQNLPLEMLIDRDGHFVLESYNISYLPLASSGLPPRLTPQAPVFVFPPSKPALLSTEREDLLLRSLFPGARVLNTLDPSVMGSPGWLHISAHFKLNPDFWLASGFDATKGRTNALALLPATRSCALVSLGVCHAANAYSLNSPYWLGFSELFLSRGAGALLVSRWALDDLSMRIYRDFYMSCRQGIPMDEALTKARRRFLGLRLERDGISVSGRHPYFWAGITYVGPPGSRLCPPPEGSLWLTIGGSVAVPLAFIALGISPRRRRGHSKDPADKRG